MNHKAVVDHRIYTIRPRGMPEFLAIFERRSLARDRAPGFAAYLEATTHLVVAQETRIVRPVQFASLDTPW